MGEAPPAADAASPPPRRSSPLRASLDPVRLELFTHRFSALAREMGEMLERTALSTNVKERLDFSCALLGPDGELVVNAPHIPVHLGALGLCVRAVAAAAERQGRPLRPGDVVVTNHPAFGGSHLPDVTVVTPVFVEGGAGEGERTESRRLLGFAASRAHHAEIGGTRPGSMPPDARNLAEEGVVLPPTLLVEAGEPRWDRLRDLLGGGPHPSRAVEENLADLAAAVAANHRGAEGLKAMAATEGADAVAAAMAALTGRAEDRMRAALERFAERWEGGGDGLPDRRTARHLLDDGSPLQVTVERLGLGAGAPGGAAGNGVAGDRPAATGDAATGSAGSGSEGGSSAGLPPLLRIDFTGTAGVHPGNLNAPPAVVRSAVLYVLRLLVGEDLPLNEGLMRPVELVVPEGMLAPPFPDDEAACPAVVGGNVETSQRVVEVLLEAFGLAAASQGTMNNVLFGDDRFGYYETVAGGCGAGPGFAGASAVHSHMTNTRITDPEILERRYPVRLERFAVRRGSGGVGRWPGGDGVVRELAFLAPVSLSVLTQHRSSGPPGAEGGEPGSPGRQRLLRADGTEEEMAAVDGRDLAAGDRLLLETPGGGGWGLPEKTPSPPSPQPPKSLEEATSPRPATTPGEPAVPHPPTSPGESTSPQPPTSPEEAASGRRLEGRGPAKPRRCGKETGGSPR